MSDLVTVTDKALTKLKELDVSGENFLRISIIPGGCSGMTYQALIDNASTPFDKILYDNDGVRILSDPDSVGYLNGLDIDYSDDLIKAGFRFNNRNAQKSCACGSSFEV
jgi:iron-sulfur cluster assembly protein